MQRKQCWVSQEVLLLWGARHSNAWMETCGQRARSFWGPRLSCALGSTTPVCVGAVGRLWCKPVLARGMDLFVLIIARHETFLCGLVWFVLLELKRTLPSQLAAAPLSIPWVPASWAGAGAGTGGDVRAEWPSGINTCPARPKDVLQQDCGLWDQEPT